MSQATPRVANFARGRATLCVASYLRAKDWANFKDRNFVMWHGEMAQLARLLGVSRQRVKQIVAKIGSVRVTHALVRCRACGKVLNDRYRSVGLHVKCGAAPAHPANVVRCGYCQKTIKRVPSVLKRSKYGVLFCCHGHASLWLWRGGKMRVGNCSGAASSEATS